MPPKFARTQLSSSTSSTREVGLNPNYSLLVVPSGVLKWGPPNGGRAPKIFYFAPCMPRYPYSLGARKVLGSSLLIMPAGGVEPRRRRAGGRPPQEPLALDRTRSRDQSEAEIERRKETSHSHFDHGRLHCLLVWRIFPRISLIECLQGSGLRERPSPAIHRSTSRSSFWRACDLTADRRAI